MLLAVRAFAAALCPMSGFAFNLQSNSYTSVDRFWSNIHWLKRQFEPQT
jgi:hypothetical protein